ncbi:hypothetical protein [Phragmitibacter flavus]|uniref:hypothetical protein n=1 Tax=Phragmitibacter flavus TaxID=2576071 RepID=UPI001408D632|nr:hypothetical protein [Phragmitibacter flavus]
MRYNPANDTDVASVFCICINTHLDEAVPLVKDEDGYVVFGSELEAQREIADCMITRLQEFLDGEREFDDAVNCQEFVLELDQRKDSIVAGNDRDRNHVSR